MILQKRIVKNVSGWLLGNIITGPRLQFLPVRSRQAAAQTRALPPWICATLRKNSGCFCFLPAPPFVRADVAWRAIKRGCASLLEDEEAPRCAVSSTAAGRCLTAKPRGRSGGRVKKQKQRPSYPPFFFLFLLLKVSPVGFIACARSEQTGLLYLGAAAPHPRSVGRSCLPSWFHVSIPPAPSLLLPLGIKWLFVLPQRCLSLVSPPPPSPILPGPPSGNERIFLGGMEGVEVRSCLSYIYLFVTVCLYIGYTMLPPPSSGCGLLYADVD